MTLGHLEQRRARRRETGLLARRRPVTSPLAAREETDSGLTPKSRTPPRVALFAVATTVLALTACGSGDSKTYDISSIFPLSSDKCTRYDGKAEGTGIGARCYVTKAKCEQAAQDWRQAMQKGGVSDAILFTCK
jgi:hypothetical protein